MKSRSFQLDENVLNAMDNYVEENNISSANILIENLLEKFLYENDYIRYDFEDVVETPAEIQLERRDKFRTVKKGDRGLDLYYGDLFFGQFKILEVDCIIEKMLNFSDDELAELSIDKWEYNIRKYKSFLRMKLDNPLLTCEEFIKKDNLKKSECRNTIQISYKRELLGSFNLNVYSMDMVDKVYDFLLNQNDEELKCLCDDRVKSNLTSDKFILKYMEDVGGKKGCRKPYTTLGYKGNIIFQKGGFVFGSHSPDMVDKVWDFLNSKGWDSFYSSKVQNLKGNEYKEWLYGEMDKVGMS